MKVLMIGNHPSVKGGITSVISQLLDHDWKKDGADMKFIPTYIEAGAVKKSLYFVQSYVKILWSLMTFKPDVFHIHMSYKGSFHRKYFIHKLCKKFGKNDIIHLHGSEFKKFYEESSDKTKVKIRTLLRECDSMIVLGDEWNKRIKQIESEAKTIVVSNTVKIPQETVQWNDEGFTVLFLGVLIKRKGVHDLLNSITLLKEREALNKTKFIIAGSGIEEENLKKQCTELNIADHVEFAGWTAGQKKIDLLKQSQLLVLPSYNEGLPIAILEAISYGIPVVSTRVGDIESAVIDGQNGHLIEAGDVGGLAEAIQKIVINKDIYITMSKFARSLAEDKFSDSKYFKVVKDCYEALEYEI